jgi:hypothetical protein
MREIRPSGLEGGVRLIPHPYPYPVVLAGYAPTARLVMNKFVGGVATF